MNTFINNTQLALDLAGNGAATLAQIGSAIKSIKDLFAKSQSATDAQIKTALAELTDQIADAKLANAQLKIALAALHSAAEQTNAFKQKMARYHMWETQAGAVVYRLNSDCCAQEAMHYICTNCVHEQIASVLQGHENRRECPRCKTGYRFTEDTGAMLVPINRRAWNNWP